MCGGVFSFFLSFTIKFYFLKVYKFFYTQIHEILFPVGLLFRNFPKYASLTVGDQKNGFVCSKKKLCKISPAGDFRADMPLLYFLYKKALRVGTQRAFTHYCATSAYRKIRTTDAQEWSSARKIIVKISIAQNSLRYSALEKLLKIL